MADWTRPFVASYRFARVSRATGLEVAQLPGVRGGTVTINRDTETFEGATLDVAGDLDVGCDLVRGYLVARWPDGTAEEVALGTWVASAPTRDIDGARSTRSVSLDGRLMELAEDAFDAPVTVAAGSNAVAYARGICEACGLSVVADESGHVLGKAWVFGMEGRGSEEGGSKLAAVNSLLSLAGFDAAMTDELGRVVMRRSRDASSHSPVWAFEEGPAATFLSDAREERDASGVANVVHAIYESDAGTVVGEAVDDDPLSPYSTVALGRRRVANYTYDATATQAEADAKASELLRTQQSVIRRVTLRHVRCPLRVGDVASVEWPSAGVLGTFTARTQSIAMGSAGCLTTTELRAFERGW